MWFITLLNLLLPMTTIKGNVLDLITTNSKPSKAPLWEISVQFKEICFSKCHYTSPENCLSMSIEELGEKQFICRYYDITFDVHKLIPHHGKLFILIEIIYNVIFLPC